MSNNGTKLNNGKNIVCVDDIIRNIENFDTKKFLPIEPLRRGFIDSETIYVNNEIGCAFSLECIKQQLNTEPSNVYIYDESNNIGYYAYISIKDPKNFREAALNNTVQKIYMDCELEILREDLKSCKRKEKIEEEYITEDVSDCNMLREEKKENSIKYDDEYYKYLDPKGKKKKFPNKRKKCNYMKSNVKKRIDHKKSSITQTKKMCNSIKQKELELSKCDSMLSKETFCDSCSIHLRENTICYYNKYSLCVDCYNNEYVYNREYDFGFGNDIDDNERIEMWEYILELNYEIH